MRFDALAQKAQTSCWMAIWSRQYHWVIPKPRVVNRRLKLEVAHRLLDDVVGVDGCLVYTGSVGTCAANLTYEVIINPLGFLGVY